MTPSDVVLKQFPGKIAISVRDAGVALGMAPKTALNRMYAGTFPVRVVRDGTLSLVYLHDLITYIEGDVVAPNEPVEVAAEEPAPKKRGRPTKEEALRKAGLL